MFIIVNICSIIRTMEQAMLADVFIKSPEQKILRLFAMNPESSFYGRQISGKLGMSLGAVHKALLSLEKRGLLESQQVGRTKLYQNVSSSAIIRTFKVLNTLLLLEPLVERMKEMAGRIILFGSHSMGTFAASSDLDLFIVTGEKEEIAKKIALFVRKSGLDIRPIIKDQVEWVELEGKSPEFFAELCQGITIWAGPGDESGLQGMP